MAHSALTDELRDQASLFSLGLLDADEAEHFSAHLEQCSTCAEEVWACTEVVAGVTSILAEEAALQPPPNTIANIKAALMRKIAAEPAPAQVTTTVTPAEFSGVIVRAEEGRWRKIMPGIEVKRLFVDPLTRNITSLLRVAAGAVYPAHRHAGLEHLYVIDGDAIFDDHTLNTGDYEARTPNSVHSMVRTTEGCLLLVIHNQHDEYL